MADDTVTTDIPAAIGPYRNRVVGLRVMPAGELLDNPRNWRQHPPAQKAGLDAVMRQVGVIDVVRYNAPTNRLWDGHLRKELFGADPATPVLVLVTDLTEEEEAVALATYDPLAGMARADRDMLAALLGELEDAPVVVEDESLDGLLRRVAGEAGVDWRAVADPPADRRRAGIVPGTLRRAGLCGIRADPDRTGTGGDAKTEAHRRPAPGASCARRGHAA